MLGTLLSLQWKQSRRSPAYQKSLVVKIILGFFIVYFALIFIALGFFSHKLLTEIYPDQSPVVSFNSFLLFYFLIDLVSRFMLQDLPVLAIQPFLHLPLKRNKLVHFVLLRSIPSVFNLLMLLVFVPFMLRAVVPVHGTGIALVWLAALLLLTFINNFILIYFKRQLTSNPKLTLILALVVGGLILLDYLQLLSLRQASVAAFDALLQQPWLLFVPVLGLAGTYLLNYRFLMQHLYPEEIFIKKVATVEGNDMAFLNRFGDTGKLIALELKLIWRHKRPKSMVMISAFLLFYGLIFYTNKVYLEGWGMLIFVGIFVTGSPMFNYGQFVPAWQSAHYDALLTRPITTYQYVKAKYLMFVPSILLVTVLTLPYALFGSKVLLINLASCLFNIGVNSIVVLYFAALNKDRLDLSNGSAFNWQGVGASRFVMMLPMVLGPIAIFLPFSLMDIPQWGIFAIALSGALGIVFHRQLLSMMAKRLQDRKYTLAAGFRQH
ncbi:DUF5687 family protein [Pontibacter lucknowensis]|uniref:ABC-2 type transport system permease protein n=1 Tax=Pontibacter lucknowensis TaxID=1077936 RepID=A0A1N7AZJ3_9BACT|nr:DUF5687 family protein [Pontibacter lucknowensis]SIR44537.1 hypothetical protein SAMN05421545_3701 [Pontibacter lucknowensis]